MRNARGSRLTDASGALQGRRWGGDPTLRPIAAVPRRTASSVGLPEHGPSRAHRLRVTGTPVLHGGSSVHNQGCEHWRGKQEFGLHLHGPFGSAYVRLSPGAERLWLRRGIGLRHPRRAGTACNPIYSAGHAPSTPKWGYRARRHPLMGAGDRTRRAGRRSQGGRGRRAARSAPARTLRCRYRSR